jgi:hypothetical protein
LFTGLRSLAAARGGWRRSWDTAGPRDAPGAAGVWCCRDAQGNTPLGSIWSIFRSQAEEARSRNAWRTWRFCTQPTWPAPRPSGGGYALCLPCFACGKGSPRDVILHRFIPRGAYPAVKTGGCLRCLRRSCPVLLARSRTRYSRSKIATKSARPAVVTLAVGARL